MGKEIKRIRINKLSSENNIFDAVIFHDGINLILGEKYDNAIVQGRKTNGVGKSMLIEFLNFGFLCEYEKSRICKIPENVFPLDEYIILELTIGDEDLVIRRNRKRPENPVIVRKDKFVQFNKLQDAKDYLTDLIFDNMSNVQVPSFRSLLSILIRDEKSEFSDILKCHDLTKRIPDDIKVHLFLLGIPLEEYEKTLDTIKKIDKVSSVLKETKNELTENGTKKIADVKAELNALESELVQLEEAMDEFKSNDAFESLETDILELENMLDQLRQKQKILKREYQKIKSLPRPEQIDDSEIELIYNQFKSNLGSAVVKSLNEVIGFKNKVEEFQHVIINQKAKDLEKQILEISEQIKDLDEQYSEKIHIIDKKGVLRNLKSSLRIYENKKESSAHTKFLFDQYDQYDKQKKQLMIQKAEGILKIDTVLEEMSEQINSFCSTILDIHEAIMGNRECSFEIKTKSNGKNPIGINLRIFDDGSHSVDRTKVFIYDMALLFNEYTHQRHPLFLIHDNIFDVDQDTLVQCLNYVYKQEEHFPDFQYILTLNRDKIENEERRKQILMDIDEHEIAIFTKANKFLKRNYQEK